MTEVQLSANDFMDTVFNLILLNPHEEELKEKLKNAGMDILRESDDFHLKESVLHKLIFIYPDDYNYYYFMGYLWKDRNMMNALCWLRMCAHHAPSNLENILDLTKILFENDYVDYVYHFNEACGDFLHKSEDPRTLFMCGSIELKLNHFKSAKVIFDKLLLKNDYPNRLIYYIYTNAFYLYEKLGDLKNAHKYAKMAYDKVANDPDAIHLPTDFVKNMLNNYMCLMEYDYYKKAERNNLISRCPIPIYKESKLYRHVHDNTKRRIKIGYVSSDFIGHAVSNFIQPILNNHNKERFNVTLYSQKHYIDTTGENRHQIINVMKMCDKDLADLIYSHNIDILFDLNGYTAGNRLTMFALNPARIQISYLGYSETIAQPFIHYRLVDNVTDPDTLPIHKNDEQLIRLKQMLLYSPSSDDMTVPNKHRQNDVPVFGLLNKECKNTEHCFRVWKQIFKKVPNCKVIIKLDGKPGENDNRIDIYAAALEIEPHRIRLVEKCNNYTYWSLFSEIDILLDTFPYSGTTTSCNALYNSTPIVTFNNLNATHVHRVTSSLLTHSGLKELIANSEDSYVDIAVSLANNPDRLAAYHATIGDMFSKTMNPKTFMEDYETKLTMLYNKCV